MGENRDFHKKNWKTSSSKLGRVSWIIEGLAGQSVPCFSLTII